MKFGLILSLDYEIFGNGSGSILDHVINPTNKILEICERNNFKLTIMFEVCEYWSFKYAEQQGLLNDLGYSPSELMEKQIKKAVSAGHDVQLHTHPQWLDSDYINGNWELNFNQWKLSDLPYSNSSSESSNTILSVLRRGKHTLEELLRSVNKDYECIAYRAGSWCIQPEKNIIKAMKNVGIGIDSSVFQGGSSQGLSSYNYENAPYSIGYWWTGSEDVCKVGSPNENILEAPIQTIRMPFYKNYSFKKIYSLFKSKLNSSISRGNYSMSHNSYFTNPLSKYPFKFDFCKLGFKEMVKFINVAKKSSYYQKKGVIPIVSIGHSKDFFNNSNFSKFLSYLVENEKDNIIPYTFKDLFSEIKN